MNKEFDMTRELNKAFGAGITIGLLMAFLISLVFYSFIISPKWQTLAIDHGCAQYNQTTGDFEWIEK